MAVTPWTDAIHTYDPDPSTRKCQSGWLNDDGKWIECQSTQRSSTLHDDPEAEFRQMHDHGGGDCMCFEDDPRGYHGAMADFVRAQR